MRATFLNMPTVQSFVVYLSQLLQGTPLREPHSIAVRDPRVYEDYPYWVDVDGKRGISMRTLPEALARYWWADGDYDKNKDALDRVERVVKDAVALAPGVVEAEASYMAALKEVLWWGAGYKATKLYTANVAWAEAVGDRLGTLLAAGVRAIDSSSPDINIFSDDGGTRMNAGLTKFFALACDRSIIYDGRVGAALGLLVRHYCAANSLTRVPEVLQFRWARQSSSKRERRLNRNPSSSLLKFPEMPTQRHRSRVWAEWNLTANWVISAALDAARHHSGAAWCAGSDGMRRVEAALFTMGYQIPKTNSDVR